MKLTAHIDIALEPQSAAESVSERHALVALMPVLDGTIFRALIDRELHGPAGTTRVSDVHVTVGLA